MANPASLPPEFARTIIEAHGAEGEVWLAALPALLADCERAWDITLAPPFELSYAYAAPATRQNGTNAVLKAGVPSAELRSEIEALRHYAGRGAVELLEADPDRGVMLLERALPGTTLRDVDDDEAVEVAAGVMRELWRPPPASHMFPTVEDWGRGFQRLRVRFNGSGPLPERLVSMAEATFAELLASSAPAVVLHGDLHHENVLRAQRRPWLAIDPKGVVGDPVYEVGAFLHNPHGVAALPDLSRVLARRVDQFSELLGLDRRRLIDWGIAQAVLSAWWHIEDHGSGWEPAIAVAEALAHLT